MALESLRDCFPADFNERITRLWRHAHTPHDLALVSGISVKTVVGGGIVDDLNTIGFDCNSMTSQPFALAHAATMSPVARSQMPVGLLSWEHSTATLVIVANGRPEFVRTLRDCSGRIVIERIADSLKLNADEALSVLATFGLPDAATEANPLARTVAEIIQPELQKIGSELQKTMMYLRHHLSKLTPCRLVLFGGMGAVPNIAPAMETITGLETKPWSLNADNSHPTDPMFAAAMAASAGVTMS